MAHEDKQVNILRRQRLKVSNACQACRLRKAKCDGRRPECGRCHGRENACVYSRDSLAVKQRPRRTSPICKDTSTPAPRAHPPEVRLKSKSTIDITPQNRPPFLSELPDVNQGQNPEQDQAYYTSHGRFASEVIATIDVRAGTTPVATSNLVPFVNAPLFGDMDLDSVYSIPSLCMGLPSRSYADTLVAVYWQYLEPLEPILDRERFFSSYEELYARPNALPQTGCEVWLSIFNIVFALAVQRNESIPLQRRSEEANGYFQRAWTILRPEIILWKPGSIELVQSLMLMNRYLHCTNNQHKTWMTAGLAVRIAQSMCFHLPEGVSTNNSSKEKRLRQRVWASCVALDRCVSWTLGRTLAPSLVLLPNSFDLTSLDGREAERIRRELEFHEIGNQIQLAQTQTRLGVAAKLGLPRLYQQEEYHGVAVQLDACLNKLEQKFPDYLKLQNIANVSDEKVRAEGYILHLRLLHTRIFLYRPMLARFYSLKSRVLTSETSGPPSLSDRLLRQWAGMCVEAAQKLASLVIETAEPDKPIGILPWWHRIFYLHIAGINFLAAMFDPDLFTDSISQSWCDVMSALRAHEHLSAYVQPCVRTFETLSSRILQTRSFSPCSNGNVSYEERTSGLSFDDVFQSMGCDLDNFLFGVDDLLGVVDPGSEESGE